jgi:hypothetical protein
VNFFHRLFHGLDGLGRRSERIFVGGQFDDVFGLQATLAGDILDGLSGFVSDEIFELAAASPP